MSEVMMKLQAQMRVPIGFCEDVLSDDHSLLCRVGWTFK